MAPASVPPRPHEGAALLLVLVLAAGAVTASLATRRVEPGRPCEPPDCLILGPGEPITLGTLLVISGENAALGIDSHHGAVLVTMMRDPVLGHPVRWVHADDRCSAKGGAEGATELAGVRDLLAVIGTSCSTAASPARDILAERHILMVSPSNTGPALTDPGTDWYARTAHNDVAQGRAVAEFALKELKASTAALVTNHSPYATGLARTFAETFAEGGGRIVARGSVDSPSDAEPVVHRIAPTHAQVVYAPIFVSEGGAVTRAVRDHMPDAELFGSDGMFTPDYIEAAGDASEGVYISGPNIASFQGGDFYKSEFLPAYEETFGEEPQSVFHAHAFDAVNMILDALERSAAQRKDGSLVIRRLRFRDAFFATSDFAGITATLTCEFDGDCQRDPRMSILRIQHGDFSPPPGTCDSGFSKCYTLSEL